MFQLAVRIAHDRLRYDRDNLAAQVQVELQPEVLAFLERQTVDVAQNRVARSEDVHAIQVVGQVFLESENDLATAVVDKHGPRLDHHVAGTGQNERDGDRLIGQYRIAIANLDRRRNHGAHVRIAVHRVDHVLCRGLRSETRIQDNRDRQAVVVHRNGRRLPGAQVGRADLNRNAVAVLSRLDGRECYTQFAGNIEVGRGRRGVGAAEDQGREIDVRCANPHVG